jgi:hypothetical protein
MNDTCLKRLLATNRSAAALALHAPVGVIFAVITGER